MKTWTIMGGYAIALIFTLYTSQLSHNVNISSIFEPAIKYIIALFPLLIVTMIYAIKDYIEDIKEVREV